MSHRLFHLNICLLVRSMVIKYMIYLFKQKRVHDIIPSWRWMQRVVWGDLRLGWTLCFCPRVQHRLPRIMESFSLGKTSKLTQSNHYPSTAKPITDPIPRCHIHTSFKSLQEQWILHFPGQPLPVLDDPFSEQTEVLASKKHGKV